MASSTPLWYSIPEWYGIQQQVDGTLLPVTSAYDARNMETGDGNLSVARGFIKSIFTAVPGTERILKLIAVQGNDTFYVVTSKYIYAWVYENSEWSWKTIYTFSPELTTLQVDALQTRVGADDTIIVATGDSQMVKINTGTNTATTFGAGLYSYEGQVATWDDDSQTLTVGTALGSEAQRRALAYGLYYGNSSDEYQFYAEVYDISDDGLTITLSGALVEPPAVGTYLAVQGGASEAQTAYVELYSNRLFAAGDPDNPFRLYWSAVPGDGRTIEDWISVDGSYDASGGYVEVGDGSADRIIGLTALSNQLLIWKTYSVWRLYGDRPSNYTLERIDKNSDIMSNAGVVVKYDAPYLLMPTGIHTYNNVSVVPVDNGVKPLRRFFEQSPDVSNSRSAVWDNRFYMTCKVPTTPAATYDNAIIVFDVARNAYMIRDGFEVADIAAIGSHIYMINGSRYVYEFEVGDSYDGQPISAYWLTQPTDFSKKMYRHQAMAIYSHITGDPVKVTVYGDYLDHSKSVTPLTARAGYTTMRFQTDQQYFIQFKFENTVITETEGGVTTTRGGVWTMHGGVNVYVLSELKL